MDIQKILKQLDELLNESKLDEAEKYLSEMIEKSLENKDYNSVITLYNEQIGFFRDCGRFSEAIDSCGKVLGIMDKCGLKDTKEYAVTLLNAANAYRASGKYEKSFEAYDKVKSIFDENSDVDAELFASYFNNISLLYQQIENYEKAAKCQEKALEIVEKSGNNQKIAISKTNLAVSLVKLGKISEAEIFADKALEYFTGLSPSDFHYSAALSAKGDIKFKQNDFESAVKYYSMALSETELHMGKNNFYDIILENLKLAESKLKSVKKLSGMELCKNYYECFGKPVIHRNFPKYEDKIVCGMVGEGSDCFGFDDEYSRDHDFGPAFCMWVDEDIYSEIGEKLQKAYDLLPKTFMGFERIKSVQSSKRTGVFQSEKFYTDLLETKKIPENISEWLEIQPEKLAVVTNGSVFSDTHNRFTEIRKELKKGFPKTVQLKHLAQQTAFMAQSGQYNFLRMLKRDDKVTAMICYNEFVLSTLKCTHIIKNKFYPYYKWLYKSCPYLYIKKLFELSSKISIDEYYSEIIEPVCETIYNEIKKQFDILSDDKYLDVMAHELSKRADEIILKENLSYKIAKMEFEAFDKVQNEGGRANCQDDWETFSIMRVSQYLTWNVPMLEQYIFDFEDAIKSGRNLITEKYARMMKSTSPKKYAEIEKNLPEIEADTVALCNAICEIQVSWMEEFSKEFSNLSSNARVIHTYEDTEWNTSYETYLRGELLTYSRKMLGMYAAFIVDLSKKNQNLARLTMENTAELYGYNSIYEAEQKI